MLKEWSRQNGNLSTLTYWETLIMSYAVIRNELVFKFPRSKFELKKCGTSLSCYTCIIGHAIIYLKCIFYTVSWWKCLSHLALKIGRSITNLWVSCAASLFTGLIYLCEFLKMDGWFNYMTTHHIQLSDIIM